MAVATGTGSIGTGSSPISVTGFGFNPKNVGAGVLFYWSGVTGSAGTSYIRGNITAGYGIVGTNGGSQYAVVGNSKDAAASSIENGGIRDDAVIYTLDTSGSTNTSAFSLSSWDSDGFTLTPLTASVTGLKFNYIAWSGLASTGLSTAEPATAVTSSTNGLTFKPKCIVFPALGNISGYSTGSQTTTDSQLSLGFGLINPAGTIKNGVAALEGDNGRATTVSRNYFRADTAECVARYDSVGSTTLLSRAALTAALPDGFTLNWNVVEGSGNHRLPFLALGTGRWEMSTYNTLTNTTTDITITPGFPAEGVLFVQSPNTTFATAGTAGSANTVVIGAAVSSSLGNQNLAGWRDTNAQVGSVCTVAADSNSIAVLGNGASNGTAKVTAFGATTVTMRMQTSDTANRVGFAVAFAGEVPISPTQMTSVQNGAASLGIVPTNETTVLISDATLAASGTPDIVPLQMSPSQNGFASLSIIPTILLVSSLAAAAVAMVPAAMSPVQNPTAGFGISPITLTATSVSSADFAIDPTGTSTTPSGNSSFSIDPVPFSTIKFGAPSFSIDPLADIPLGDQSAGLAIIPTSLGVSQGSNSSLTIDPVPFFVTQLSSPSLAIDPLSNSPSTEQSVGLAVVPTSLGVSQGSNSALAIDPVQFSTSAIPSATLIGSAPPIIPLQDSPLSLSSPSLAIDPVRSTAVPIGSLSLSIVDTLETVIQFSGASLSIDPISLTPIVVSNASLAIDPTSMAVSGIPTSFLSAGPIQPSLLTTIILPAASLSIVPVPQTTVQVSSADLSIDPVPLSPVGEQSGAVTIVPTNLLVQLIGAASLGISSVGDTAVISLSSDLAIVPAFLTPISSANSSFAIDPLKQVGVFIGGSDLAIIPSPLTSVTLSNADLSAPSISPTQLAPRTIALGSLSIIPLGLNGTSIADTIIVYVASPNIEITNTNAERKIRAIEYRPVTLEAIDRAITGWLDGTVAVHVEHSMGERKRVPVVFSSGERFARSREKKGIRDKNGVLILPVMSLRRMGVSPEQGMQALGVETQNFQISRRIAPDTSRMKNAEQRRKFWARPAAPVYEITTIPFPTRVIVNYELNIQTQYVTQMNTVLEKVFSELDIQKSFVAELDNHHRHPALGEERELLKKHYVVGFIENEMSDSGNFEEFTDRERIVSYKIGIQVPATLQLDPEGEKPSVQIEKTSFGLRFMPERVTFVDGKDEIERIFGGLS